MYLRSLGHDVVALEPGSQGFSDNARLAQALSHWSSHSTPEDLAAEDLDPGKVGKFDLICSFNVLEHMHSLDEAIAGMTRVLATHGRMIHLCPNYAFPYEPHFGLPLLPISPSVTRWLLPARITQDPVWKSLNFVTAARLRRIAAVQGLSVSFAPGLMAKSLDRLDSDGAFRERQPRALRIIGRLLSDSGLKSLVRVIPPQLATPMLVEMRLLQSLQRKMAWV